MLSKLLISLTLLVSLFNISIFADESSLPLLEAIDTLFPSSWLDSEDIETLMNKGITSRHKSRPGRTYSTTVPKDVSDPPRVHVAGLGTARGRTLQSLSGKDFFAFHSIPYAKPITPEKRFTMSEMWEGEWSHDIDEDYDATYLRAKCPQQSLVLPIPAGREDCLHLNIYTPNTIINDPDTKYPVMFFIHGGAFLSGESSLYVPTKLMNRDVIVVGIQYRLGSFGFLASGTPDNPGNMGLMDQIVALRWVQKYIHHFNGDPNSVTVFGHSAGAASTSWLQLTPRTQEGPTQMIHRFILESGSALEAWAHDSNPKSSFELQATAVECWDETAGDPVSDALFCMRFNRTVQELTHGYLKVYVDDRSKGGLGFLGNSPVIQKDLIEGYPEEVKNNPDLIVIPDHPLKIIQNNKFLEVPFMCGSVRDEGSLVMGLVYSGYLIKHGLENNSTFFELEFLPIMLNSFGIQDFNGAVSSAFRKAFLNFAEMGNFESMSGGLVDMNGMLFLKSGMWTLAHLLTHQNPKDNGFFYSFEFESDDTLFPWIFMAYPDMPIDGGITHSDELMYLFHMPSLMINDERQLRNVDRMTLLWTNFAKYGDPTPENALEEDNWKNEVPRWNPFSIETLNYMLISDDWSMERDFSLRWNHNTIPDPACNNSASTKVVKMQESLDDDSLALLREETNGWKVAVGAMGACSLLMVMSIILLLLRTKQS